MAINHSISFNQSGYQCFHLSFKSISQSSLTHHNPSLSQVVTSTTNESLRILRSRRLSAIFPTKWRKTTFAASFQRWRWRAWDCRRKEEIPGGWKDSPTLNSKLEINSSRDSAWMRRWEFPLKHIPRLIFNVSKNIHAEIFLSLECKSNPIWLQMIGTRKAKVDLADRAGQDDNRSGFGRDNRDGGREGEREARYSIFLK